MSPFFVALNYGINVNYLSLTIKPAVAGSVYPQLFLNIPDGQISDGHPLADLSDLRSFCFW